VNRLTPRPIKSRAPHTGPAASAASITAQKRFPLTAFSLPAAVILAGCAADSPSKTQAPPPPPQVIRQQLLAEGTRVTPPALPRRPITPPAEPPPGQDITLDDRGAKFTLFLPPGWGSTVTTGQTVLTVHFHGEGWHVIQEHLRRGAKGPLLCVNLGQGSSAYRVPFEDRERFARLLRMAEQEMVKRGAPPQTRVAAVDVSSFSAGYGAVRELMKSPQYVTLIRRIVLADSMYASFEPTPPTGPRPSPAPPAKEHIDPWLPFCRAAARGEKTFLFTHSQVPTETYANSAACAAALIDAVGAPNQTVPRGTTPASADPEFPLTARADLARFHVWSYAGSDAQAHLTHIRHLADLWTALDRAGQ